MAVEKGIKNREEQKVSFGRTMMQALAVVSEKACLRTKQR